MNPACTLPPSLSTGRYALPHLFVCSAGPVWVDGCSSSFPHIVVVITEARYGSQSIRWGAWLGEMATPAGE